MSSEEEPSHAPISRHVVRRLFMLAWPRRGWFAVCLLLVALSAACDLTLPWLSKHAIDGAIVPRWVLLPTPDAALVAQLRAHGAQLLDDGRLAVDLSELSAGLRTDIDSQHRLSSARWVEVETFAAGSLPLVHLHDGRALAAVADWERLPWRERLHLRAADRATLTRILGWFTLILGARLALGWTQSFLLQLIGQRIMSDLRRALVAHLLRLPVAWFDRTPVGRVVTRATNDVGAINEVFTSVLVYLVKDVFVVVGVLWLMALIDGRLAVVMAAALPCVLAVSLWFRARATASYRELRRTLGRLNAFVQERLAGMRVVHWFAQEARTQREFEHINDDDYRAQVRQLFVYGVFMPLIAATGTLGLALIVWQGGASVGAGTLTLGALVAFIAYIEMLFAPIRDLAEKHNLVQAASAAAERIFQVQDQAQEDEGGGQQPGARALGRIEFRNVWFAYQAERWVLRDVSFVIEPGQHAALVGATGSGKTTIIALLMRFYDVQRGAVLIDGVDVRELDRAWLRGQFAAVQQDVFLFAGTVRDNITLLRPDADQRAANAVTFVGAERFVTRLTNGLDAPVNERGTTLSSGERQLLSLARAVAADPAVLILDEATANIDSDTEQQIQTALTKLLHGRSALTIAHRLSTIRAADVIVVLRQGAITAIGSHQELLQTSDFYRALTRQGG